MAKPETLHGRRAAHVTAQLGKLVQEGNEEAAIELVFIAMQSIQSLIFATESEKGRKVLTACTAYMTTFPALSSPQLQFVSDDNEKLKRVTIGSKLPFNLSPKARWKISNPFVSKAVQLVQRITQQRDILRQSPKDGWKRSKPSDLIHSGMTKEERDELITETAWHEDYDTLEDFTKTTASKWFAVAKKHFLDKETALEDDLRWASRLSSYRTFTKSGGRRAYVEQKIEKAIKDLAPTSSISKK